MEVPASGMGASGPERANTIPLVPPMHSPAPGLHLPITGDSIATLLGELSQADIGRLLQIVEAPSPAADLARADLLLSAAGQAVATQNTAHALNLLRQFAELDPARAETLPSTPGLAAIRPSLEQLLTQMSAGARLRAEGRLAEASQKLEILPFKFNGEVKPEIFLLVATKLLEAGGLGNYIRSEALSNALLDQSRWAPAAVFEPPPLDRADVVWHFSLHLLISIWAALGIVSIGLCWWLRSDYLPLVCGVWTLGLALLLMARAWQRSSRS